ncbi:MAG: Rne/Rng family ribonuclease [Candidatus Acetothermia bacterium]|nr:Rne/Rng family ribonuclease [Candidatus Acetothermia bacterium]
MEKTPAGPRKRVVIVEEGELVEVHFDMPGRRPLVGNIYKGKVETVLPGMGAAFVNVGERKALFLSEHEINDAMLIAKGFEPWRGPAPIQKVLRPGDSVLIQVRREGVGKKNPQGTTKISLPGRYWVFLPREDRVGISRRVEDRDIGRRLRQIAYELKQPGEGLIARTAAHRASKEDLERDFKYLLGIWKGIEEAAAESTAPKLLHEPLDLVRTIVRDRFLDEMDSLIVDEEAQYKEILDFLGYLHLERLKGRVKLYRGTMPLFVRYDIERQLREALQRRVPLKAGGFLTVDETEALTAIDVNTGSDVRHRNQDAAILNTNLEAAKEIPRILRLRKISGIIVIDFVDMASEKDERKVIERLQEELRKDRVPADFIEITKLGLVEITRRKEGESLAAMLGDMEED